MASNFVVSTIFKGQDLISPIFKRMGLSAKSFGDKTSRAFGRAGKKASSFGNVLKGILAAGIIQRGISALTTGLRTVTSEFIDFDQALTAAGAKFPTTIKRGTKAFNELGSVARKVGAETQFTAADAAKGLDFLAMAGFNANQAMKLLPGVANLATIANSDMARATDIASDALGAFNMMTKDTGQLQTNFGRILDVMSKTVTSANVDMEQMFETMKFAGPVVTNAGQSLETFATLTSVMANAGIKGSLSGTALRTAFTRLVSPPAAAATAIKKLKLQITDSSGNIRDMMDIMDDLRKRTKNMGEAQRLTALSTIFGKRALAGMSVVLNATDEDLRAFRKNLERSGGAAKDMSRNIRQSIGNRLKEMQSALIELGFRFLEAFVGKGEKGLDKLIDAIRRFDITPIVDGVKTTFKFLDQLITGVRFFATALEDLKPVIIAVTTAVLAAKAAQWLWNLAMLANPIGMIIAGLALAVVGIWIVAKNWNQVKEIMVMAFLTVEHAVMTVIETIQTAFISMVNLIIRQLNRLIGIVSDFKFEEFKVPDNTASLKRQAGIAEAFNKSVIEAAKNSERIKKIGTESFLPRMRAQEYKGMSFDPQNVSSELEAAMSGGQSVDPSAIAASQNINFQGLLQVAGAGKGSSFESKTTGAPPIKTELLGTN